MVGCSQVSPGCAHCYAKDIAERFWGPSGFDPVFKPDRLKLPARWRDPRRVFVNSMSDLFHEAFTDDQIGQVFDVMLEVDRHVYQVLTKRSGRLREFVNGYADARGLVCLPAHIWAGPSIENNRHAFRADDVRATRVAVRMISAEPLLGPIPDLDLTGIDWLIVGGESGPRHRRLEMAWARDLRDKAAAAGTAFFFKQDSGGRTELRPWIVEADGRRTVIEEYPSIQEKGEQQQWLIRE